MAFVQTSLGHPVFPFLYILAFSMLTFMFCEQSPTKLRAPVTSKCNVCLLVKIESVSGCDTSQNLDH